MLSRAAPPPPPPPVHAETEPVISASVSRTQVTAPITHGTPFAAHPYVPPSGAPGFAGDRAWNKGFEFDKENVERVSVRLVGRKESTTPVLSVGIADKVGFLGSDLEVPRIYLHVDPPSSSGFETFAAVVDAVVQLGPGWDLAADAVRSL